MDSLKKDTLSAFIWSSIERFSVQFINLFLSITLARILLPSDFGIIGMLNIFLALSQSIIDCGFSNALIHKKDRTQTDYSTIFYVNIGLGIIIYLLLFVTSPYIAKFYNQPILSSIIKVAAINMIINSLVIVQRTKLTIELKFKTLATINTISVVLSGIIGLFLAYKGYGVWSLVYQTISLNLFSLILTWYLSKWQPTFVFSRLSFNSLFKYGSKLLITSLYGPIFENLSTVIIGKLYTPSDLGYYTKSMSLAQFPALNASSIVSRVSFPVLSKIQDDDVRLKNAYRNLIKITYLALLPLMLFLVCFAEPIILFLLTDKWLLIIPYFQIICIAMLWYPICAYNINLLLVKGKVDIHLKLDIIKKITSLFVLIICSSISIKAICFGMVFTALFSWFITSFYSGKLIGLSFKLQIKDILYILFICLVAFFFAKVNYLFNYNYILKLSISVILYIGVFFILSLHYCKKDIDNLKNIILKKNL